MKKINLKLNKGDIKKHVFGRKKDYCYFSFFMFSTSEPFILKKSLNNYSVFLYKSSEAIDSFLRVKYNVIIVSEEDKRCQSIYSELISFLESNEEDMLSDEKIIKTLKKVEERVKKVFFEKCDHYGKINLINNQLGKDFS